MCWIFELFYPKSSFCLSVHNDHMFLNTFALSLYGVVLYRLCRGHKRNESDWSSWAQEKMSIAAVYEIENHHVINKYGTSMHCDFIKFHSEHQRIHSFLSLTRSTRLQRFSQVLWSSVKKEKPPIPRNIHNTDCLPYNTIFDKRQVPATTRLAHRKPPSMSILQGYRAQLVSESRHFS